MHIVLWSCTFSNFFVDKNIWKVMIFEMLTMSIRIRDIWYVYSLRIRSIINDLLEWVEGNERKWKWQIILNFTLFIHLKVLFYSATSKIIYKWWHLTERFSSSPTHLLSILWRKHQWIIKEHIEVKRQNESLLVYANTSCSASSKIMDQSCSRWLFVKWVYK